MVKRFAFAVPGDLTTPTGGYAYDRRIIEELSRLGWQIEVIDLGDGFPWPGAKTRERARTRLRAIPKGQSVVIDGLALGVLPEAAVELGAENPLVALVHHPLAQESGMSVEQAEELRVSERAALAAAHDVIVTSMATARTLTAHYGVPAQRITVAVPGNDPASVAQGSKDGTIRLLSVGSIIPRKGYDVLVAALATLRELPWQLTVAGDRTRNPGCAAQVDAEIASHTLSDRISILGAVSSQQLTELYVGADAFALASRYEGYGMAYTEAIAHGLPVIGTSAGATADTVPSGTGILVPPDNVPAFAQALARVISNRNERERLAAAARAAAAKLPTWQDSAKIFSRVLETLA